MSDAGHPAPTYNRVRRLPRLPSWQRIRSFWAEKMIRAGLKMQPDSNLISHAREELQIAGFMDQDSMYSGMLGEAVVDMQKLFAIQRHSGMSASAATSLFEKVSRFEPLTPLTGEDGEWNQIGEGSFQNRRCSHVFKDNGGAYDIRGRIFREPSGVCFSSKDSHVPVKFPYMPSTEYVDVDG